MILNEKIDELRLYTLTKNLLVKNMNSQQYESILNDLKKKYLEKEDIVKPIIKEIFPPPQMTYDRFMGEIGSCNKTFYSEADLILKLINIDPEISEKTENEIKNRLNALKSIIDKMSELSVELVVSSSSSYEKDGENELNLLLKDMQELIASVDDYEITKSKSKNIDNENSLKENSEIEKPKLDPKYEKIDQELKDNEIQRLIKIRSFPRDDESEPNTELLTDDEILRYATRSHTASRIRLKRGIGTMEDKTKIYGDNLLMLWGLLGSLGGVNGSFVGWVFAGVIGILIALIFTVGISALITIYLLVLKDYKEN